MKLVVSLLAVLVVVGFLLAFISYQGRVGAERELDKCRWELGAARAEGEKLSGELSSCRETLSVVEARASELESELGDTLEKVEALEGELELLQSRYTSLEEDYRVLESSYEELGEKYNNTLSELGVLRDRYTSLRENYTRVLGELESLRALHSSLRENYTQVLESYRSLESRYRELQEDYSSLVDSYGELESRYNSLQQDYEQLESSYSSLLGAVWRVSLWLGFIADEEEMENFYTELLRASTEEVKELVDLAGVSGSLGWRSLDALRIASFYLFYCNDSFVRYVDPLSLSVEVWQEVLMMPNETWTSGCGDCDDLALFVYSILAATKRSGEELFLVVFYGLDFGHMGVLAVDSSRAEKRYYVVDPAGDYLNGVGIYIRLLVEAPNGTRWYLYLDPMGISWSEKNFLLQYSSIVYYDPEKDEFIEEPIVYYYTNAFDALRDWMVGYWGIWPVEKIVIIGLGVYEEFTSISDAARWVEENT